MTILKRGAATRAASGPAQRLRLPPAAAFWLVAGAWFLLLFAAAAPSPLYGVYQAQQRFSAITLTAVFGVYALGLLAALLVFGSVSDYLGRRRVISVAMAAGAGACGLVLGSRDPLWGGLVIFLVTGTAACTTSARR